MKLGRRGSTALEFAIAAPLFLLILFGCIEYGRAMWTWQALQLAGDQTARCVAIGGTACATPTTYAVGRAKAYGAFELVASGVTVDTQSASSSPVVCALPGSNTATHVKLSLTFSSPVSLLLPALPKTLTTTSCYPLTGT
jgi:Flp pilus assembly protein TadG